MKEKKITSKKLPSIVLCSESLTRSQRSHISSFQKMNSIRKMPQLYSTLLAKVMNLLMWLCSWISQDIMDSLNILIGLFPCGQEQFRKENSLLLMPLEPFHLPCHHILLLLSSKIEIYDLLCKLFYST